jgi:hypothetical protein
VTEGRSPAPYLTPALYLQGILGRLVGYRAVIKNSAKTDLKKLKEPYLKERVYLLDVCPQRWHTATVRGTAMR